MKGIKRKKTLEINSKACSPSFFNLISTPFLSLFALLLKSYREKKSRNHSESGNMKLYTPLRTG